MRLEFTRRITRIGDRLYISIPKPLHKYIDRRGYYKVIVEPVVESES